MMNDTLIFCILLHWLHLYFKDDKLDSDDDGSFSSVPDVHTNNVSMTPFVLHCNKSGPGSSISFASNEEGKLQVVHDGDEITESLPAKKPFPSYT